MYEHPVTLQTTVQQAIFQSGEETIPDNDGETVTIRMRCYKDAADVRTDHIVIEIDDIKFCYNTLKKILDNAEGYVLACKAYYGGDK